LDECQPMNLQAFKHLWKFYYVILDDDIIYVILRKIQPYWNLVYDYLEYCKDMFQFKR